MRGAFLILVLANLLLLAWQFWVEPVPVAPPTAESSGLILFSSDVGQAADHPEGRPAGPGAGPDRGTPSAGRSGNCFRLGPLADTAAAQQAGELLAARGIQATPVMRDTQVWLGHWVQIGGFASAKAAEAARQRLVAGGLADTYLMQDGTQPMLSLGVFRDRNRADRIASVARGLGFQVATRNRYRPTVEPWLLVSPRPDQMIGPADLSLTGDRILRSEVVLCEEAAGSPLPVADPPAAGRPT